MVNGKVITFRVQRLAGRSVSAVNLFPESFCTNGSINVTGNYSGSGGSPVRVQRLAGQGPAARWSGSGGSLVRVQRLAGQGPAARRSGSGGSLLRVRRLAAQGPAARR